MTEVEPRITLSEYVTLGPKRDKKISMNVNDLSRLPLVCRICLAGCTESEPPGVEVQATVLLSRSQLVIKIDGEMSKKLEEIGRSSVCGLMARWPSSPDPVL